MKHQCHWCPRTVRKTVNFCSEKCRYEYNTAKDTSMDMARVPGTNEIDTWGTALASVAFLTIIFIGVLIMTFLIAVIGRITSGW